MLRTRAKPSAALAKLAEIEEGRDSPARWEAEHPRAHDRLAEAEQAFKDAVEREADRAIANPGEHLTRVLGERPTHNQPVERDTWERAARAIENYRITYHIGPAEPSALGPEPDRRNSPWRQHIDWAHVGEHVLDTREQLAIEDSERGPLEERITRVERLVPDQDRDRALDRDHGWEL